MGPEFREILRFLRGLQVEPVPGAQDDNVKAMSSKPKLKFYSI
jgi:hypothetical protein